jgi:LacI family transcriptional regulator
MKRKYVTIRDVAAQASVSRQTVSRVLTGRDKVAAETRARVLAVIDALGYRPNKVAQGLVTRHTYAVGLAVGDISNPFFPEVARGVLDAAQAKGYNVFLCNTDGNPQQELRTLQSLAAHAVDGIIVYPSYDSDGNLKTFAEQYRPLVVVNHIFEHPGVSMVLADHYAGARLAVDYLVGKGHTAIGMLTGVLDPSSDKVRRIRGFREALAAHGLPVVNEWIVSCLAPSLECGYEAARQLLTQHPRVTAIFAYNDLLALGAVRACKDLGRQVPADCAIVGFDDIQWAATATPSLTTIRVHKYELGQQAMNRLLAMLDDPEATFSPLYLEVELVIRESA